MDDITNLPTFSWSYSIPYLLLAVAVLLMGYNQIWSDRKVNLPWMNQIFLVLLFLLFFGFRWHIFTDTLAYETQYYDIRPDFSLKYVLRHSGWWDSGYVVFAMISQLITRDFHFFVILNTLVDICLFSICLKKYSQNYTLTILFFLAFQGIITEINLMRNIKAILIFVLSIGYIKERNLKAFLVCILIAFYFHSSSLLYIPMYWILQKEYNYKALVYFSIIMTAIYLFNINVLESYIYQILPEGTKVYLKVEHYMEQSEEQVLSMGTLERVMTLVLALYMYRNVEGKKNSLYLIFFNSFIIFYSLYAMFGFNYVFRDRIPNLFIFSYWFLYPFLFDYYSKKHVIFKYFLILLIFLKIGFSTRMCAAYYENILFETSTKYERVMLINKVKNN